jgi:RNA polymerase sigma-70 factor (ECF subfamily)
MAIDDQTTARFEALAVPHLDAAYNLARWLTRNDQDAADVAQDAYLRALRYFDSFSGADTGAARVWLLAIVRNTCFSWMQKNRRPELTSIDEEFLTGTVDAGESSLYGVQSAADARSNEPEARLLAAADAQMLDRAIEALPLPFREVIIMRELEDLSYKEIAGITGVALGTVMSRLSRGRQLLRSALSAQDRAA